MPIIQHVTGWCVFFCIPFVASIMFFLVTILLLDCFSMAKTAIFAQVKFKGHRYEKSK